MPDTTGQSLFRCDWCDAGADPNADGVTRWLMGALRHTAGATGGDARHDVARPGQLLRSCPACSPLVRARDAEGLVDRARAVTEAATGAPPKLSRLEHGLIFRAMNAVLVTEVADETRRPTAAEREAWALASARANSAGLAPLMSDAAPRRTAGGS